MARQRTASFVTHQHIDSSKHRFRVMRALLNLRLVVRDFSGAQQSVDNDAIVSIQLMVNLQLC